MGSGKIKRGDRELEPDSALLHQREERRIGERERPAC